MTNAPSPRPPQSGIDPRSPRFGAAITAALLLLVVGVSVTHALGDSPARRAVEPGFILFAIVTALFGWGAFAGVRRHPYGLLFTTLLRPRLSPPTHREDPKPPNFAQGVGFAIGLSGLVLHLAGLPYALAVAASLAFIAAFLNAVFGFCLGCHIYLLLARARARGARGAAA